MGVFRHIQVHQCIMMSFHFYCPFFSFLFSFFIDSIIICSCNLRVFQFLTWSLFMFGTRLDFFDFLKKNVWTCFLVGTHSALSLGFHKSWICCLFCFLSLCFLIPSEFIFSSLSMAGPKLQGFWLAFWRTWRSAAFASCLCVQISPWQHFNQFDF